MTKNKIFIALITMAVVVSFSLSGCKKTGDHPEHPEGKDHPAGKEHPKGEKKAPKE